ncbi:G2-specific serine/threonine protein kinase [Dinochytrium kinnereticum]|nr:G2-specific serine/threonine protein kinase [Dinochytrium kinnereticum]
MENYEPLEVIGSGSFGMIRKVRRKSDGKILACKEIDYRKMTEKEKKQLVAEVNILRELRHPNIVRYYERSVDKNNCMIYIIMEYCEGGDLSVIIRHKRIPEDIIWNLLTQLLLALHECHHGKVAGSGKPRPSVIHRDIKPDNVFLDGAQNVKLGDFGLSRIIENPESEFAKTYVGTPFYMSPEVFSSNYNMKSDVWALGTIANFPIGRWQLSKTLIIGCLIYELCALEPPFQAKTQSGLTAKIKEGRISQLPSPYSLELSNVVRAMLTVESKKRPGTTEILKLGRIRLVIKERELSALQIELRRKDEDLKRREAALDVREAAVAAREDLLRRAGTGPNDAGQPGIVRSAVALSSLSCASTAVDESRRVPDQNDSHDVSKQMSGAHVSSRERRPLDERRGSNTEFS